MLKPDCPRRQSCGPRLRMQAWHLPLTSLVHVAFAVLHEGSPVGPVVSRRLQGISAAWPLGTLLFFWVSIVFGVSFMEQGVHSLHWGLLMSSLMVIDRHKCGWPG